MTSKPIPPPPMTAHQVAHNVARPDCDTCQYELANASGEWTRGYSASPASMSAAEAKRHGFDTYNIARDRINEAVIASAQSYRDLARIASERPHIGVAS